ncbi:helix-turn-helix domain-containing protein [Umezawaea tangerina]|uniref:DNA-binding IclR family transcriptional regulator n=1 Tax=Umezawaea tangerina TaxID=84725 RepID=A0A2T0T1B6_9PSEU|nr:helix-turn-helix domain-containing protein [Umezawaea tangerina]PRY39465.1 DNA-binding IclR family transcriptional regulator [Umezawaea tangerina]
MTQERTRGPVPPTGGAGRGVVDGAFRVLHALPETGVPRQVARLAELTGLPRPTVHRLLGQLRQAGAVDLVDGRWVLAADLLGLARRVEPLGGLRESAAPVIRGLRAQTGAAVSLVVPDRAAFVALEMVPGQEALPIDARPGAAMPTTTAAGIVLDDGRTPSPRRRGFGAAVDDQDVLEGLTCYATTVALPGGGRAALQIATPAARPADRFAAAVHHAARALERRAAALVR